MYCSGLHVLSVGGSIHLVGSVCKGTTAEHGRPVLYSYRLGSSHFPNLHINTLISTAYIHTLEELGICAFGLCGKAALGRHTPEFLLKHRVKYHTQLFIFDVHMLGVEGSHIHLIEAGVCVVDASIAQHQFSILI